MRPLFYVLAALFLVALVWTLYSRHPRKNGGNEQALPPKEGSEVAATQVEWPPLPQLGPRPDKAATREDVNAGRAIFALESLGVGAGTPLPIPLPQYAFHVDKEHGIRRPVIVVQAEVAGNGMEILGYTTLDGKSNGAGLSQEFELLGTEPPPVK